MSEWAETPSFVFFSLDYMWILCVDLVDVCFAPVCKNKQANKRKKYLSIHGVKFLYNIKQAANVFMVCACIIYMYKKARAEKQNWNGKKIKNPFSAIRKDSSVWYTEFLGNYKSDVCITRENHKIMWNLIWHMMDVSINHVELQIVRKMKISVTIIDNGHGNRI